MRLNPKNFGGTALVIIAIVTVLVMRLPRNAEIPITPEPEKQPRAQTRSEQNRHTLFAPVTRSAPNQSAGVAPVSSTGDATAVWEKKMDTVLRDTSEPDGDVKAEKLLALFPTLPEAGQLEVMQHIINLTSDEHYAGIERYTTNAALPEDVAEELFDDLLNRPNSVKLPTLLSIANNPQHPNAGEARDVLELYLDEDYGNDWRKWEQTLYAWLKDNPD